MGAARPQPAQCMEVLVDCDENRDAVPGVVNKWTLFLRAAELSPSGRTNLELAALAGLDFQKGAHCRPFARLRCRCGGLTPASIFTQQ